MRRRSSIALVVALGGFLAAGALSAQAPTLETARALLAKGAYAEASAFYTALLQQGSLAGGELATVYLERGIAQQKNGYVSQAVTDYTNALWLKMTKSARGQAKINRGIAFLELGQFSRAINDFDSAIEQDGKLAEAYFGRATARRLNGEPDKAISDYVQALALGGDRPDLIHFGQGLAYESLGKRAAAIESFRKAVVLAPQFTAARTKLQSLGEKLPDPTLSAPAAPKKMQAGRLTVADAANAVLAERLTGAVALGAAPQAPAASGDTSTETTAANEPAPANTASLPQPSSTLVVGSFSVQIAAYFERPNAERGLSEFSAKFPQIAEGTPTLLETAVLADGRTVYRLKLGPYSDAARAGKSCQALKALGQNCIVVPLK